MPTGNNNDIEIIGIYPSLSSETIYIEVMLTCGEEIEFKRHVVEERGNIVEYDITIEDERHQKLFDKLNVETQDEIYDLIQQVSSEDY